MGFLMVEGYSNFFFVSFFSSGSGVFISEFHVFCLFCFQCSGLFISYCCCFFLSQG